MKVQGRFKMQAHINSSVVVDIAAFKVSHSVGSDIDATTALRAARVRSKSIGSMERYVRGFDMAQSSLGPAMIHRQTVSTPWGRWMKCHRRFKMQALTSCDAKFMSTRTAAGQFKVVQWGHG